MAGLVKNLRLVFVPEKSLLIEAVNPGPQPVQPRFTHALLVFRRAANLLARAEDAIVFNGLPNADPSRAELDQIRVSTLCRVTGGELAPGLVAAGQTELAKPVPPPYGENLVTAVAAAISDLELYGHLGPFACIMGMQAFVAAQTPNDGSLVLPSKALRLTIVSISLRAVSIRSVRSQPD